MPRMPIIQEGSTYREITQNFYGYDHKEKIADGEFYDTQNLTTAYYPLFAVRKKRGFVKDLYAPGGLIDKVNLAYVDDGELFLNDRPVMGGLTVGEKQLVGFGAYICIFPDKKYYNTADPSDYGDMAEDLSLIPDMDFVIECKNRLWGCKYGVVDGQNINEIYACELGNFGNWTVYEGISTDPYTASVGSDGPWTGAINYMGYPTFFKEDRIHRVAVSAIGAHEITETVCDGIQQGSAKSAAVLNGLLYYKSNSNVCIYQGGTAPTSISDQLGDLHYSDACAGIIGDSYYISMKDNDGKWSLFVYDTKRGLWMREDSLHVTSFAAVGEELYALDADKHLWALKGSAGDPEEHVLWYGESGVMYYQYPDKKYVSRFNIRLNMEKGSRARVSLMYDSSGRWERMGELISDRLRTITLPIKPRRCDHLRIRIEGIGDVKIYSIARVLELGSDY